jgi:UDP-3-O-[3-hydroxymyristoyl] N-acetylglucosamine deacetylase
VRRPFTVREGVKEVTLWPAPQSRISLSIDFAHPMIGEQRWDGVVTPGVFAREIAPARTFGFLKDVEMLQASGLARGGSLENAVVLDDTKVLNPEGLRFPDEFVRHKVLDLIGDLALAGRRIQGRVIAERAGHAMHTALVQGLLRDRSAWGLAPGYDSAPESAAAQDPALRHAAGLSAHA